MSRTSQIIVLLPKSWPNTSIGSSRITRTRVCVLDADESPEHSRKSFNTAWTRGHRWSDQKDYCGTTAASTTRTNRHWNGTNSEWTWRRQRHGPRGSEKSESPCNTDEQRIVWCCDEADTCSPKHGDCWTALNEERMNASESNVRDQEDKRCRSWRVCWRGSMRWWIRKVSTKKLSKLLKRLLSWESQPSTSTWRCASLKRKEGR